MEASYKKPLSGLSLPWLYWRPPESSQLRAGELKGARKAFQGPMGEKARPLCGSAWAPAGLPLSELSVSKCRKAHGPLGVIAMVSVVVVVVVNIAFIVILSPRE